MLQIIDNGPRYDGYDCITPTGERYRAGNFHRLVEKVQARHPLLSESWMEADWCRRHPHWCVEVQDIPPDAPSRIVAFSKAMAARATSGIGAVSASIYEHDRYGVCLTCPQFRGERGIGLISCKECGCSHLKAWASRTRCPANPPKWRA